MIKNDIGPILQLVKILQTRIIINGGQQVLAKWEGVHDAHGTWEDWLSFQETYPHYNLEDKVIFNGGSYVISTKEGKVGNHRKIREFCYQPRTGV